MRTLTSSRPHASPATRQTDRWRRPGAPPPPCTARCSPAPPPGSPRQAGARRSLPSSSGSRPRSGRWHWAPLPAFAAAFVGWNPLLAIDFAGGGHNDVWMMALVLGALALAARHPGWSGSGWALAGSVKWVAIALLPLNLIRSARGQARAAAIGFVAAAAVIAVAASLAFGTAWFTAMGPVAQRHAAWAVPSRLGALGLPGWLALMPLVAAAPWLVHS